MLVETLSSDVAEELAKAGYLSSIGKPFEDCHLSYAQTKVGAR